MPTNALSASASSTPGTSVSSTNRLAANAPATAPAHGEWNDVPRLQRVLAEPLRPVAINDDFRGSLASFADPSFMTPAAHRIRTVSGTLSPSIATISTSS